MLQKEGRASLPQRDSHLFFYFNIREVKCFLMLPHSNTSEAFNDRSPAETVRLIHYVKYSEVHLVIRGDFMHAMK